MRTKILSVIVITVCVLLVGCRKPGSGTNPFVGRWSVQLDRTMAEGQKHLKKDGAKMVRFATTMMNPVSLEITAEKMVFHREKQKEVRQYTVKSRDDEAGIMTVASKADGKKIEIVFSLIEGKYMNFKSAGSDDMNYYVWERESMEN